MKPNSRPQFSTRMQSAANSRWWVAVAAVCIAAAALTSREPQSAPTPDPVLERRLTRDAVYKIRPRDTLERVSYYLYGKRSWWEKLRAQNPELRGFEAHDRLPAGKQLHYRAPSVGDSYTVQPGDWLIRIVEWKYGDRDKWEQVFQVNAQHLANPNLIHPGDTIDFTEDGRVTHRGTGAVLMNAEEQLKRTSSWFGVGLLVGGGFLVAAWLALRHYGTADAVKKAKKLSAGIFEGRGEGRGDKDQVAKTAKTAPAGERPSEDYPYGFKKRPVELYRAGFKPILDSAGDLDGRNGYHRITKSKALTSRKKKKAS